MDVELEKCALCENRTDMRLSHIVPHFAYKHILSKKCATYCSPLSQGSAAGDFPAVIQPLDELFEGADAFAGG